MFKKALLFLICFIASVEGGIIQLPMVSSNQFKAGTNGIYLQTITDRAVLSNAIPANTWTTLNTTTANVVDLKANTVLSTNNSIIGGTLVVTNTVTLQNSLSVGGGTAIIKVLTASATLDFPATATNQISTLDITVTGAGTNGVAFLNVVSPNANFTYSAVISATNTVTVRAANISINNAVDPAATAARVVVFQY